MPELRYPHRATLLTRLRESRDSAQVVHDQSQDDYSRKQAAYWVGCFDRQIQMIESWGDKDAAELIRSKQL